MLGCITGGIWAFMAVELRKGFRLGSWLVEPLLGRLSGASGETRVEPKVMDVLVALAEQAGELVTREQLLFQVWGERAVTDEPLTRAVGELRRALGDRSGAPEFIETVPKRGYRLLQQPAPIAGQTENSGGASGKLPWLGTAAAVLAVAIVLGVLWNSNRSAVIPSAEEVTAAVDAPSRPTLAVLEFCDLSGGEGYAYFGMGLAEDLTTLLARSPELFVIANTSASQFACLPTDLSEVGRALTARYLVTGSVRITPANQMRLTARLVDTGLDRVVWSDSYERDFSPSASLAVQGEIAANIARSLEVQVLSQEARVVTEDPTAWQIYARGRHLFQRATPEEVKASRELLEQAVELDPGLAGAHSYLGMIDVYEYMLSWNPGPKSLDAGEARINLALDLDSTNHIAQAHLAFVANHRGRFREGVLLAQRAIDAVPSYNTAYAGLGICLLNLGELAAARQAFEQAIALNPRAPLPALWSFVGTTHFLQGNAEEAFPLWERTRKAIPGVGQGMVMLTYYYQSVGRTDDARKVVAEILALHPEATAGRGHRYIAERVPEEMLPADFATQLAAAGLPP